MQTFDTPTHTQSPGANTGQWRLLNTRCKTDTVVKYRKLPPEEQIQTALTCFASFLGFFYTCSYCGDSSSCTETWPNKQACQEKSPGVMMGCDFSLDEDLGFPVNTKGLVWHNVVAVASGNCQQLNHNCTDTLAMDIS